MRHSGRPAHRDFAIPSGAEAVIGVYVNGVERRRGSDFEVLPDRLRFRRPLRPPGRLTPLGTLMTALCAGVYPTGDEVDVIVRRGGALESLRAEPLLEDDRPGS